MEIIAEKVARAMKQAVPDKTASEEILKFGFITLINNVFGVFLAIMLGWMLGMPKETALTVLAVAVLRFIVGGIHFRSMLVCLLISVVVLTSLPHVPINTTWSKVLTCFSLVLILVYAPSNISGKTRIPEKYFPLLKLFAFIIVSLNLFFLSGILAKSFFTASLGTVKFRRRRE